MIALSLAEIASVTGGHLDAVPDGAVTVTGPVVADSREVAAGGLFVAVRGERVDGHDFAAAAVAGGAAAVLAEHAVGVPAVLVDDSVRALGDLARAVLDRAVATDVVGVTGSSGKTSTKDLLAQVLAGRGPLVAPQGSYNTEVGVPLTVLAVDEATRTLVLEMGARGTGHIAYLCQIAPPGIGIVLNVGSAHLGEFGDRESIARSKAELVEALPPHGTAVLNGDDPLVRRMAELTEAKVLMVGESVHADIRAESVGLDRSGRAAFMLVAPGGTAQVRLQVVGEHQVGNALAAAGAAHALGLGVDEVAAGLTAARPLSRWRMEVVERADGVTVVNDAYNANPESMRAALTALVAMAGDRRTWAVLGEMRELGEASTVEHEAVGRLAVRLDVGKIVAVGEGARAVHVGAANDVSRADEAAWVPDIGAALALLRDQVQPGDVVLVKASRAAGLEQLADALLQEVAG
ncbi:MAG TPA: UDP-N-acetylmuramoyl-tripeptide--D-alanyl-D-alanine ligase [Jiangellaceae bacterium]|nr:UDP-N-acetylmuramoyl-tripeptide--D-alanyl-D-alanine ligase [Jiangellaceae bacterium]